MRTGLVILLIAIWPLQGMDDLVRGWVQQQRSPMNVQAMQVVSSKSRAALVVGAAAAALSGVAGRVFVAELGIALVPVNLAVEGLKYAVGRVRPDGDAHRRNSSFPSSHAANAFTVAAVAGRRSRTWGLVLWPLATLVGYSRMLLDRHWASDVLGGCFIALAGAWFAAQVLAWWEHRKAFPAAR
ncbi:MAG: phosphatase PAP2 family protein [Candidatus Eisenbacteria bacterium]|nr:phosphatase PAP2 family protein [Candidatus Eisenbacteria bacterium]